MGKAADFFVSYTRTDRAWAEWIAWQLEADGYQVVFQAWDFIPGYDWAHGMQRATATAERLVVVLSSAYLQSDHGEAEWRAFYARDPSGEQGLLLPVRVGDVEPPGLLRTRIYVDLVGRDANSARATLLAAARRVRGKPTSEPEFPGTPNPSVSHGIEAPQFPGEEEAETPTRSTHDLRGGPELAPSSRPPRSELLPELLEAISSEAEGQRVEAESPFPGTIRQPPSSPPAAGPYVRAHRSAESGKTSTSTSREPSTSATSTKSGKTSPDPGPVSQLGMQVSNPERHDRRGPTLSTGTTSSQKVGPGQVSEPRLSAPSPSATSTRTATKHTPPAPRRSRIPAVILCLVIAAATILVTKEHFAQAILDRGGKAEMYISAQDDLHRYTCEYSYVHEDSGDSASAFCSGGITNHSPYRRSYSLVLAYRSVGGKNHTEYLEPKLEPGEVAANWGLLLPSKERVRAVRLFAHVDECPPQTRCSTEAQIMADTTKDSKARIVRTVKTSECPPPPRQELCRSWKDTVEP